MREQSLKYLTKIEFYCGMLRRALEAEENPAIIDSLVVSSLFGKILDLSRDAGKNIVGPPGSNKLQEMAAALKAKL